MQYQTPQRSAEPARRRRRPAWTSDARICKVFCKGAEDSPGRIEQKSEKGFGWATDLHVQNFLDCVRTRKTPTAPMQLAFQAALVVQMANLSLRQGRRLRWNAAAGRVENG